VDFEKESLYFNIGILFMGKIQELVIKIISLRITIA
jgi:hypothetical protein